MAAFHRYDQQADFFAAQYESVPFEQVHKAIIDLLPGAGSTVLDIGSGSGRDAAWFASRGYQVVAADPSEQMRAAAIRLHQHPKIRWLADSLPDLTAIYRLGLTYDLILLSAVWMHVPPGSRARCLRKLATLLSPGGRIAISLRLGEPDAAREMHSVSYIELADLARQFGLRVIRAENNDDQLGRSTVSWMTVVLGLPDDGLGVLPLLRNLILRDEKSSTYKIALLRILTRIADVAAGAARYKGDSVVLPLGLVSLFWLRMYKPLIENGLPQMPCNINGSGPGFVGPSFHMLKTVSAPELRVGMMFRGQTGLHLHKALSTIAQTIRTMPAGHLFWPSSDKLIFHVEYKPRKATPELLRIDDAFLWSLGDFHVPAEIWHALCHHNVWIEPVLVAEWIRLMTGYSQEPAHVRDKAGALLAWGDPERDTRLARAAVERLRASGKSIYCVWSGQQLKDQFEIDHCFPFSAWPCDDLWNLMPASKKVNLDKSNRLVTNDALQRSAPVIEEWWSNAYIGNSEESRDRFFSEAQQTLPLHSSRVNSIDVIDAMKLHRIRLHQDQQLQNWAPKNINQ
jgi:SAM-dependent methyltransferase